MSQKKYVVLVVEDEMPLQEAIKTKLKINDFQVVTARTVNQTKNYLEELDQVDVIWLDHYLLGKEDGLDLVTDIKSIEKYRNIPIFVVSNTASDNKITSYLQLGIEKYYVKSEFRLDEIIDDIKKTIS